MSRRDAFLKRIRSSAARAVLPEAEPEHPGSFQGYRSEPNQSPVELIDRFEQELTALAGYVYVVEAMEQIGEMVLSILHKKEARRIMSWGQSSLAPYRLPEPLLAANIEVVDSRLPADAEGRLAQLAALDSIQVGLTTAQGGLADTGAIALVSGPERGRLASLLPPVHIAILPRQKIYASLPAFLAAQPQAVTAGSNLVFVAGPSRTGDIEMTLTMGVHGPGELHVIIAP